MQTKFSEDVVPLSDLKVNPGKVVKHSNEAHRPIFVKAIAQGLMEAKEGNSIDLSEAKEKLGL